MVAVRKATSAANSPAIGNRQAGFGLEAKLVGILSTRGTVLQYTLMPIILMLIPGRTRALFGCGLFGKIVGNSAANFQSIYVIGNGYSERRKPLQDPEPNMHSSK